MISCRKRTPAAKAGVDLKTLTARLEARPLQNRANFRVFPHLLFLYGPPGEKADGPGHQIMEASEKWHEIVVGSFPFWESEAELSGTGCTRELRLPGRRSERNVGLVQLSLRCRSRGSAARTRGNSRGGSSRHSERAGAARWEEEDTPRSACGSALHCGRRNPYT